MNRGGLGAHNRGLLADTFGAALCSDPREQGTVIKKKEKSQQLGWGEQVAK